MFSVMPRNVLIGEYVQAKNVLVQSVGDWPASRYRQIVSLGELDWFLLPQKVS